MVLKVYRDRLSQEDKTYRDRLSQEILHIGANLVFHNKRKHIYIDCHIVRDKVLDGVIRLLHIITQSQLTDLLTKALNCSSILSSFVQDEFG